MKLSSLLLAYLLATIGVACSEDHTLPADAGEDAEVDAGPSCTELIYSPTDGDLTRWPEPLLLVDDDTTGTGRRIRFVADDFPEIAVRSSGFLPVLTDDLSDLDGFGVNAEAFFRFGRAFDVDAVPTGDASADPSAGLGFVTLDSEGPTLIPVNVRFTDDDATPIMAPMRPLPPASPAAVFITRALTDAAGGCLEPSEAMAAELAAPSPELADAIDALIGLGVIESAEDLVAISAFVTQSTVDQSLAIAADIAARDYAVDAPLACVTTAAWTQCDGTFTAFDYRDADGVIRQDPAAVSPVSTYQVPLRVWLPPSGAAPYRTVLFGHGLGSGREQGEELARHTITQNVATIAIPALQHGEHPTNEMPGRGAIGTVIEFFAIGDLESKAVDGLVLRDHFRQSTYDKLQLTRLLEAGLDADGDGTVDLDAAQMAYVGASLGGIMGAELLALTDAYPAAILAVPGSNVISIVSASELFGPLVTLLVPPGATTGDVQRFFPVLQTILDRGDGGSYAPHVLRDRLVGDESAPPPSVILGVALDDDTVPNVSSWSLARALDVPITPELLRPVPGMEVLTETPVSGNVAGGAATAGLIQFDIIERDGAVEMATHSSTPGSDVAARAWLDFLSSHWDDGLAVIVDPYALTGLAHGAP
jgi:hypothetical protein